MMMVKTLLLSNHFFVRLKFLLVRHLRSVETSALTNGGNVCDFFFFRLVSSVSFFPPPSTFEEKDEKTIRKAKKEAKQRKREERRIIDGGNANRATIQKASHSTSQHQPARVYCSTEKRFE